MNAMTEMHANTRPNFTRGLVKTYRWAARLLSGLLLLLFGAMFVAEGSPTAFELMGTESLAFLALATMLAGLVVAFFHESRGTVLILLGYVGFSLVDGDFNANSPFIIFLAVGLLYVAARLLSRSGRHTLAPSAASHEPCMSR